MYFNVQFNFKDLPKYDQDVINKHLHLLQDNSIIFGDHKLILINESISVYDTKYELKESTIIKIVINGVFNKIPTWLEEICCKVTCEDSFVGSVTNGLYRRGNAKASATSFLDEHSEKYFGAVTTKISIEANGKGATALMNAQKLYRELRSSKLNKKNIVETWPNSVKLKK